MRAGRPRRRPGYQAFRCFSCILRLSSLLIRPKEPIRQRQKQKNRNCSLAPKAQSHPKSASAELPGKYGWEHLKNMGIAALNIQRGNSCPYLYSHWDNPPDGISAVFTQSRLKIFRRPPFLPPCVYKPRHLPIPA